MWPRRRRDEACLPRRAREIGGHPASVILVQENTRTLPFYAPVPLTPLPLIYRREHLFPYPSYGDTAPEPVPRAFRMVTIENEFLHPPHRVLVHDDRVTEAPWPGEGLNWNRHARQMTAFFWKPGSAPHFGAFHHDLGHGLMHLAEPAQVPGKKVWTYGVGRHRAWAAETIRLLTATVWPREHQRQVRTELWRKAKAALGEAAAPVPDSLHEDTLAPFGAYWSDEPASESSVQPVAPTPGGPPTPQS